MLRRIRRFWKAREGLAAIEFALIAPVLGTMLLGTIELCDALECHQKVTMVASTAADLVAQSSNLTSGDMQDVFAAAAAVIYPFQQNNVVIVVSSVLSDGSGNGTVAWSVSNTTGKSLDTGDTVTLNQALMPDCNAATGVCTPCAKDACSVIYAQVSYNYTSPIGKYFTGSVPMTDYFYERPRKVAVIPEPS